MGQVAHHVTSIEEFARRLGGKIKKISETPGEFSSKVSIDTRTLEQGSVYIAIRGKKLDGHEFLLQAKERGAVAYVIDNEFFRSITEGNYLGSVAGIEDFSNLIVVPDTTRALQKLATSVRDDFKGPCVGITGSSGKTTTKEITKAFMKSEWKVLASEGNQNNYIGLPLTLLKIDSSIEAILAELGASYPGEIGGLCDILKPDWGIITNVYPCHLEGFGNLENIYKTKIQLAESILSRGGTVVINGDDNQLVSMVSHGRRSKKIVTFGAHSNCDYSLTTSMPYSTGIQFSVNDQQIFRLETQGLFNVMNALAAIALGGAMGMNLKLLAEVLNSFSLPKSRFQTLVSPHGIRIIDDAYNSNPTSFRLAVESFETMKTDGRKVLVCADMLELGERKNEFHRGLGEGIARKAIDVVVSVGPLMKEFLGGLHSVRDRRPITYGFDNNQEAREFLKEFLRSGDLVLFKGSRGMKLEEIIQCFML